MISLRGLSKTFGRRVALHPLTLEVPKGRIFGLLGHNGAGKSTTIGILLGQIFPDQGQAWIDGVDVLEDRHHALAKVGAIFESPSFYDYLSGEANLNIFCEYTGFSDRDRVRDVIRLVGLEDRIQDRVSVYSHGMRQRLALAQALLPDPQLLILDEPSEGLDPEGIHEMRALILKLNKEWGLTILFSSHLLSEVEQICSDLAVLKEGRMLFCGEWRQCALRERLALVKTDRQIEAEQGLLNAGLVHGFVKEGHGRLTEGVSVSDIAEWLVSRRFKLIALTLVEQTLEDFYLDTVRSKARGEQRDL